MSTHNIHFMQNWRIFPVPQISEGFRATMNNSEENIVRSIGTFTTKQFFTEKMENRAENA